SYLFSCLHDTREFFTFSVPSCRAHRLLTSFPTRRSSDLVGRERRHPARSVVDQQRLVRHLGRRTVRGRWRPELTRTVRRPKWRTDRKSTRLNSSHLGISYAVFCLKKKKRKI